MRCTTSNIVRVLAAVPLELQLVKNRIFVTLHYFGPATRQERLLEPGLMLLRIVTSIRVSQ